MLLGCNDDEFVHDYDYDALALHYESVPTGSFTLGSISYPVIRMAGTTAPGGTVLATVGGVNSIVAVDTGGTLANSFNSSSTRGRPARADADSSRRGRQYHVQRQCRR